jgi:hypothetical protein
MLGVVPVVEIFFGFGIDVRRDEQKTLRVLRRYLLAGQDLLCLVAPEVFGGTNHALGPRREILSRDRAIRRA